jgi:hypothetical protein
VDFDARRGWDVRKTTHPHVDPRSIL